MLERKHATPNGHIATTVENGRFRTLSRPATLSRITHEMGMSQQLSETYRGVSFRIATSRVTAWRLESKCRVLPLSAISLLSVEVTTIRALGKTTAGFLWTAAKLSVVDRRTEPCSVHFA